MSRPSEDFYRQALQPGTSGYFSEPSDGLDPNLFDGLRLRQEVRYGLLGMLEDGLHRYLDLSGVNDWLHAWLAGSGITYQWSADRGNGDLDVLFGVDMRAFVHWNPAYHGIPERDVADYSDAVLKQKLWPATAHTRFGQQEYEVTFFWAPGTGKGVEHIHPYAAYDLKADAWVVTPPALPHDPRGLYPREWYDAAGRDDKAASYLVKRHDILTGRLASIDPGASSAVNANAELQRVYAAVTSLFTDIHAGRQVAFGEQGYGYGDWANFRWQAAKQSGAIGALKGIITSARAASASTDNDLYGGPIDGPQQILTRDMLRYGRQL